MQLNCAQIRGHYEIAQSISVSGKEEHQTTMSGESQNRSNPGFNINKQKQMFTSNSRSQHR